MQERRWFKVPGPGEFRGEGAWVDYDATYASLDAAERDTHWQWLIESGYLPTSTGDKPDG